MPHEVIRPVFDDLCEAGYAHLDGEVVRLTPAGQVQLDRIQHAWRQWLDARLDDFAVAEPGDQALLDKALSNIATKIVDEGASRRPEVTAAPR
jgi:hypothetical protein